jgi:nucleoid-associated protein YgaU
MADQRVELPQYSMFAKTPVYEVSTEEGNEVVFGLLQDVIVPDPTDAVYVVPIGGLYRLDLISQSFYGVPNLWWVIARVNGILDPLVGAALGDQIRIPSKTRLAREGLLNV